MRRVLSVSATVELVVINGAVVGDAKVVVTPTTLAEDDVLTVLPQVVITVVIEVVAADDIVDTVVVTVGPSGCRRRAILLEPNSVNQTFSVVPPYV